MPRSRPILYCTSTGSCTVELVAVRTVPVRTAALLQTNNFPYVQFEITVRHESDISELFQNKKFNARFLVLFLLTIASMRGVNGRYNHQITLN
jgi:hypothetical protein